MIKQITPTFRIKTEYLNWTVQEQSKKDNHFDFLDSAINYILDQTKNGHEKIKEKAKEFINELSLANEDNLSASHLTRIVKHPAFTKKVSQRSLDNLKTR